MKKGKIKSRAKERFNQIKKQSQEYSVLSEELLDLYSCGNALLFNDVGYRCNCIGSFIL